MTVNDFKAYKENKRPLSMVTCYDSWSAAIISESDVDCILVGDSLANTMHGYDSTIPATVELMALHTAAVRRGAPQAFIIGDMPFFSFRKGMGPAMEAVEQLMRAGANAVKLEGYAGNGEIIRHVVESGVPVMGHLGLTPQSFNSLGGYRVQAKEKAKAQELVAHALALQESGCFSVVLECLPSSLGQEVTEKLTIPTIGIGAGNTCDGQVLVLQDLLGLSSGPKAKFVRTFMDGYGQIKSALNEYSQAVKERSYPEEKETYK